MLTLQTMLQLFTIMLALTGAYLVAHILHKMYGRIDYNLLRAKAFLNESFMKDNWLLLFLICFFFLVNAAVQFNEMLGLFMDEADAAYIEEITIFGVLACSVLSEYKWFKLINPTKYNS
ncbi:MAG: hypothetical protein OIN66_01530 [Candidatus Methanoperedens sp.]|nr:hypothetical protein [Candidatus Methanoperedens sp.]